MSELFEFLLLIGGVIFFVWWFWRFINSPEEEYRAAMRGPDIAKTVFCYQTNTHFDYRKSTGTWISKNNNACDSCRAEMNRFSELMGGPKGGPYCHEPRRRGRSG